MSTLSNGLFAGKGAALAAAASIVLALSACSGGVIEDVKKSVTEARQALAPSVSTFAVTSPTPTNQPTVAFNLVCANASFYLITESSTPPASSDAKWSGTKPSSYLIESEGAHTLYAWAKSSDGSVSAAIQPRVIVLDTTAPTISAFALPAGASSTTQNQILAFDLSGSDANGISAWLVVESASALMAPPASGWISGAQAPYNIQLSSGSGGKTIYAFARDAAGNVGQAAAPISVVYQDAGTAPSLSAFTRSGSAYTTNPAVSFSLESSNATAWMVRTAQAAPSVDEGGWLSAKPSSLTLDADGAYTVYAWARNDSGQVSSSLSFPVTLDRNPPSSLALALGSGSADPTTVADIAISLSGSDAVSGIESWYLSESSAIPTAGSDWKASITNWTLSSGSGLKHLYAWAKDKAGNISQAATLDLTFQDPATAPTVTSFSSPSAYTNSSALSVTFAATLSSHWMIKQVADGATPVAPMAEDAGWQAIASAPSSFTLSGPDGAYDLYAWTKNAYGQISSAKKLDIVYDTAKPSFSFTRTSSSPSSSKTVSFSLVAASGTGADLSGIGSWLVKADSGTLTGSESWPSSPPSSIDLTAGNYGAHAIYAWAKDRAGNVSDPMQITAGYYAIPSASLDAAQSSKVSAHEKIVIDFSESMNTASVALTGDFAALWSAGHVTATWAPYGEIPNVRLTIAPTSAGYYLWPAGSKSLGLSGSSSDGIALGSGELPLTVSNRVYVSASATNRLNQGGTISLDASAATTAGTRAIPMATLQYAVDFAALRYQAPTIRVEVCATGGSLTPETYSSNYYSDATPALAMKEGVSVLGGFSPSNWDSRDASIYTTLLKDSSAAYTGSDYSRAVTIGNGITRDTSLDGCTIQAATISSGSTIKVAAIVCGGNASPTINGCTANGGSIPTATLSVSEGIHVQETACPLVSNSTLEGGTGYNTRAMAILNSAKPADTIAIQYCALNAGFGTYACNGLAAQSTYTGTATTSLLVIGCLISAAENATGATMAYAVNLAPANNNTLSAHLYNNVIIGGKGDYTATNANLCTGMGVYCYRCALVLIGNTICSGDDGRTESTRTLWPSSVYIDQVITGPVLIDNYLFASSSSSYGCGIYEASSASCRPAILKNNSFSFNIFISTGYRSLIYKAYGSSWFTIPATPSDALCDSTLIYNVNTLLTGFSGNLALNRNYSGNEVSTTTGRRTATAWPSEVQGGGLSISTSDYPDFPTLSGNYLDKDKNPRTSSWSIGAFEYD